MASSSSSFCTVPVVTNMIGPEEMTLMKYMFLVFLWGSESGGHGKCGLGFGNIEKTKSVWF